MFSFEFSKHFFFFTKHLQTSASEKRSIWIFLKNRDLQKNKKLNVNHFFSLVRYQIKEFFYSLLKSIYKIQIYKSKVNRIKISHGWSEKIN